MNVPMSIEEAAISGFSPNLSQRTKFKIAGGREDWTTITFESKSLQDNTKTASVEKISPANYLKDDEVKPSFKEESFILDILIPIATNIMGIVAFPVSSSILSKPSGNFRSFKRKARIIA